MELKLDPRGHEPNERRLVRLAVASRNNRSHEHVREFVLAVDLALATDRHCFNDHYFLDDLASQGGRKQFRIGLVDIFFQHDRAQLGAACHSLLRLLSSATSHQIAGSVYLIIVQNAPLLITLVHGLTIHTIKLRVNSHRFIVLSEMCPNSKKLY